MLINDIVARPDECAALVAAYERRAACVANTFRCKLPHKKAFFAVLTDPAYAPLFQRRASARSCGRTCRGRGWSPTCKTERGGTSALLELARRDREQLVLKPNDEYGGTGVLLGWEASEARGTRRSQSALRDPPGTWVVQERIPVRREVFPHFDDAGRVTMRDMLVDLAPYLFRGRLGGYLTRLSTTRPRAGRAAAPFQSDPAHRPVSA